MSVLLSIEAAVAAFANARAPGIYKGDYLKELFRRYGDVEDAPAPPPLPDWCFDEDEDGAEDDDGNVIAQDSGPSSSASQPGKKKKERLKLVRRRELWEVPGSLLLAVRSARACLFRYCYEGCVSLYVNDCR